MRNSVDGKNIVIIGSGIGGLSTGIILSLMNFHVTVVEKNPLPGGLMRSYRRGGIDCPVGIHYVGALWAEEPLGKMFAALESRLTSYLFPWLEKASSTAIFSTI